MNNLLREQHLSIKRSAKECYEKMNWGILAYPLVQIVFGLSLRNELRYFLNSSFLGLEPLSLTFLHGEQCQLLFLTPESQKMNLPGYVLFSTVLFAIVSFTTK